MTEVWPKLRTISYYNTSIALNTLTSTFQSYSHEHTYMRKQDSQNIDRCRFLSTEPRCGFVCACMHGIGRTSIKPDFANRREDNIAT